MYKAYDLRKKEMVIFTLDFYVVKFMSYSQESLVE